MKTISLMKASEGFLGVACPRMPRGQNSLYMVVGQSTEHCRGVGVVIDKDVTLVDQLRPWLLLTTATQMLDSGRLGTNYDLSEVARVKLMYLAGDMVHVAWPLAVFTPSQSG